MFYLYSPLLPCILDWMYRSAVQVLQELVLFLSEIEKKSCTKFSFIERIKLNLFMFLQFNIKMKHLFHKKQHKPISLASLTSLSRRSQTDCGFLIDDTKWISYNNYTIHYTIVFFTSIWLVDCCYMTVLLKYTYCLIKMLVTNDLL